MPRAFTEREKELIRERLLEQGYRLFSAYGLKKTNVDEVAAAAGISKGAFYNFYESKEALFMAVMEQAEIRARRGILATIDLPGPSPRARLFLILKKAFGLLESIPILQFLSSGDYEILFRRVPPEILREHMASDQLFIEDLIARCREAGIPIRVQPQQIVSLLYPLILALLHRDDLGRDDSPGSVDVLLELVAAYCLGEVELQLQSESK